MPVEITMPQLSDTMTEGTVVKWLKKEGDKVKEGELIAEIETDKANMEFESEAAGSLAARLVGEGEKAAVGAVIAVVAASGESAEDIRKQYAGKTAPRAAAAEPATATATAPAAVVTITAQASDGDDRGGRASPLARRIAQERGVDLSRVQGTGPGGRIVKEDVLSAASGRPAAAPAAAARPAAPAPSLPERISSGQKQVIPLTKMRATIAQRVQQAKQQIPHIYLSTDIDMDPAVALRERLNRQLESQDVHLSLADLVTKAVASALVVHPELNAHFDAANNQVVRFGDVHLGLAVALPEGLIVPVLRNVEQMGLRELRVRSADLYERAKAQKLKRDELTGGTFTISNLGPWGLKQFDAVINPPEVAILAVAAAEKRAVVRGGEVVAGTVMTVTLSADHRAIDGAAAAAFLRTLKAMLEEPAMMLV
jgi:pyruvate dehydrogenase E2 component (dihydrolipoamide acetyltransferase)